MSDESVKVVVPTPQEDNEAATKKYVDESISTIEDILDDKADNTHTHTQISYTGIAPYYHSMTIGRGDTFPNGSVTMDSSFNDNGVRAILCARGDAGNDVCALELLSNPITHVKTATLNFGDIKDEISLKNKLSMPNYDGITISVTTSYPGASQWKDTGYAAPTDGWIWTNFNKSTNGYTAIGFGSQIFYFGADISGRHSYFGPMSKGAHLFIYCSVAITNFTAMFFPSKSAT